MIDLMAPGVRDAMMGTLMEPALHAVEAVARQATLGDKYDFALALINDLVARLLGCSKIKLPLV